MAFGVSVTDAWNIADFYMLVQCFDSDATSSDQIIFGRFSRVWLLHEVQDHHPSFVLSLIIIGYRRPRLSPHGMPCYHESEAAITRTKHLSDFFGRGRIVQ